MKITIEQLKSLGACAEGIAAFENHFGSSWKGEWDSPTQIRMIQSPLRGYVGWATAHEIIPRIALSGANLRAADLSGAEQR